MDYKYPEAYKYSHAPDNQSPRPETEELVEKVISFIKKTKSLSLIDIATGSGIIAITLKHIFLNLNVSALDISKKAIDVAKVNEKKILKKENSINFLVCDAFQFESENKFDILVSNPPYVALNDKQKLSKDLSFEPKEALFAGQDGYDFYKKFIPKIKKILKKNGAFFFEIGYNQGDGVIEICKKNNINNAHVLDDLSSNNRFLICENYCY